jgi:acetyl esterase/lipase
MQLPRTDHVAMRANMESMTGLMPLPADVATEKVTVNGVAAEWVSTPDADPQRVVLYLHGGAYVIGSINTHRDLAGRISRASRGRVLNCDYRLAPEHPHPAAVDDALAAYRWLLDQATRRRSSPSRATPRRGLTIATLVAIRDAGCAAGGGCLPLAVGRPRGIGESMTTAAHLDPMVQKEHLVRMGKLYLGDADPRSPLAARSTRISPAAAAAHPGRHRGDAARRLDAHRRARARKAGVDRDARRLGTPDPRLQAFAPILPEGQQAVDQIGEYLRALVVRYQAETCGFRSLRLPSRPPIDDTTRHQPLGFALAGRGRRAARQLVPRAPGLGLRAGERLVADDRHVMFANMVVLRAPGEVYLQGSTRPPPTTRASSSASIPRRSSRRRSPDLDAGGVWWPGGIVAHANSFLYVTHGTFCHALDRDCRVVAKRRPAPRRTTASSSSPTAASS